MDEKGEKFRKLAEGHKLTSDTIDMLLKEDYNDVDALVYMDGKQFTSLTASNNITETQKGMLRTWLLEIKGKYYGEQIAVDQSEAMKQLNLVDSVPDQLFKNNASGILKEIEAVESEVSSNKVNVGITGGSGMGKSTLINTLRSMIPKDEGAAETSANECTMELKAYHFAQNPNIILWDMPGVGTVRFPKDSYVKEVGLARFDALIICSSLRFTENDTWLAQQSQQLNVPFYLIRTKIDVDIKSSLEDYGTPPEDTIAAVREKLRANLEKAKLPSVNIYLIDAKFRSQLKYDFPKLIEQLINNAPQKNINKLIKVVVCASEKIINDKEKAIKAEIPELAKEIAKMTDLEQQKRRIRKYLDNLLQWFGIHKESLIAFDLKVKDVDSKLHQLIDEIEKHKQVYFTTRAYRFVFSGPVDSSREEVIKDTKRLLEDILLQCKMTTEKVLEDRKKKAGL